MGSFFSSNRISESKTQARKVVGAFFVLKDDKDGAKAPSWTPDEAYRKTPCRSMEMTINGTKQVVMKPQWFFSRPYFAMDSADPKYGVLAGWYQQYKSHKNARNFMHGPVQSIARWVGATSIPGASQDSYLDSMNKTLILESSNQLDKDSAVTSDMLWPTDEFVYDIPVENLSKAVVWNVDYSPRNLPFAGLGRDVVQHGSVILEPRQTKAAFVTDKVRDKIVSLATMIPPVPFVRAMRGVDERASDPAAGQIQVQKPKRWIVLIGGAHPANDSQGIGASPRFADVAFSIGSSLAVNWPALEKYFSGIVTASGAGLCDSVTWDEEVARGFCSVRNKEVPIFHVRDVNQVALEGMCCDVPFGHGVILSEVKDDWSGKQRDLVLSLLAQDGLVIYGGLPQQNGNDLQAAIAKYSFLPRRAPLMSVVVGGASPAMDSLNLTYAALRNLLEQYVPTSSSPIFDPLSTMRIRLLDFFSRAGSAPPRQENVSDEIDLIWDPNEAERETTTRYPGSDYGNRSLDTEIQYRLPVVYAVGSPFRRQRALFGAQTPISGFNNINIEESGYGASEDTVKNSIANYANAVILDIAGRIDGHFVRPAQQRQSPGYYNNNNMYPQRYYNNNNRYDDYRYY